MEGGPLGDRCSLHGAGIFKSTLSVYISGVRKQKTHSCRGHNNKVAADVNGGRHPSNQPPRATIAVCRLCGSDSSKRRQNQQQNVVKNLTPNGMKVVKAGTPFVDNYCGNDLFLPMYGPRSSQDMFDANNNTLLLSDMTLCSVREGVRLWANGRAGTEKVDSVVIYNDSRRFKTQILVSPGLCPCPSAFSETSFMHLTNTNTRFKNRVVLHNRQFKTKRQSETINITPKSVHKNYKTTLTCNLNMPHPPAWHETKLDFVPRKHRSVYYIGFSNNRIKGSPNTVQKFSLEKWKFAEIDNAFSKMACLDLHGKQCHKRKDGRKNRNDDQSQSNEVDGEIEKALDSKRQCNPNQVIITNVLSTSPNETPKHKYFTLAQIS